MSKHSKRWPTKALKPKAKNPANRRRFLQLEHLENRHMMASLPPLLGSFGADITYTENGAPLPISQTGTVTDADSWALDQGKLVVGLASGGEASDRLTIKNQGRALWQISTTITDAASNSGTVAFTQKVAGVLTTRPIGTFSGGIGTKPLTVSLNANAIHSAVQALLRNIVYSNTSNSPSTTAREVTAQLTDGDGGTSSLVTKRIAVKAVNDAPNELILSNSSVVEGQPAGTVVGIISSADPDAISSFTFTLVAGAGGDDNGSFQIVGDQLKARTSFNLDAKSSYSIRVRATDKGGLFFERVFSISVIVTSTGGSTVRLIDSSVVSGSGRILLVEGTEEADILNVRYADGIVEVRDNGAILGRYKGIGLIEIVGRGGNDRIDLRGVPIMSRIFGGDGNDTIDGGNAVDVIQGGADDDTLRGHSSIDVIYGDYGSDTIDGGANQDLISYGTTAEALENDMQLFGVGQVNAGDINLESESYDRKVLTDLQYRFRDKYGFVMLVQNGSPHPDGEATYSTATAAVGLAAETFDPSDRTELPRINRLIEQLLETLIKHSWDAEGNPARHPEIFDYDRDGRRLRVDPLTKDSFGQIITAALYAFQSPNTTARAKELARELIGQWNSYLILNQWRTVPEHLMQEMQAYDWELKYDIYNEGGYDSSKERDNRKMAKGPESYLLAPHERYALQNVSAKLGFVTSHWNVWLGTANTIAQLAADYVGNLAGHAVKGILEAIEVDIPFKVKLSVGGKELFSVDESLKFGISSSTEQAVAESIAKAVKDAVQYVNLRQQLPDLAGLIVDRLLGAMPDELGADVWRPILTSAVQQVMPWLQGTAWLEAATFVGTLESMKLSYKEANAGYAAWAFLAEMETRPEMADLIRPFARDFLGYLRNKDNNNGIWAHLAGDPGEVSDQISRFRDNADGRDRWADFQFHRNDDFWTNDYDDSHPRLYSLTKAHSRFDYLTLKGLQDKGAPQGLGDVAEEWLDKLGAAAQDLVNELIEQAQRTFEDTGEYFKERWDAFEGYVKERWDALGNYAKERWDAAGNYVKEKWDAAGNYFQERGNAVGVTYTETRDAVGRLLTRAWDNSGKWLSQQLDGLGNVLQEWSYFGGLGSQLNTWRSWTADGAFTGYEEFTSAGKKIVDQWLNDSGKWISQKLDGLGHVLQEWSYFGGYGSQLNKWRSWTADGVFTGYEEFTSAGKKIWDQWLNSSGKWISQKLDGLSHVLQEWSYFSGYGSQLSQWRSWTADGVFTGYEEFTSAGKKIWDKWLNSSGKWISQELDGLGHVLRQWYYYGGSGSQVYEWAAWTASGKTTNIIRYTTKGVKTFEAYISTTGNWVERSFSNGVEYAVRVWDSAGTYLGDQYKNWSDAASNLDPTTKDWWPF